MSEREGSQRERGGTRAGRPAGPPEAGIVPPRGGAVMVPPAEAGIGIAPAGLAEERTE